MNFERQPGLWTQAGLFLAARRAVIVWVLVAVGLAGPVRFTSLLMQPHVARPFSTRDAAGEPVFGRGRASPTQPGDASIAPTKPPGFEFANGITRGEGANRGGTGGAIHALQLAPGFPRHVTDDTGISVVIPARPVIVVAVGETPSLPQIVPPARLRTIPATSGDPPKDVWRDAGLLVIPALHAAAMPAWVQHAENAGIPVYRTAPAASLDDWRDAVLRLGRATGRDHRAAALVAHVNRLATRPLDQPGVRVLVLTPEAYTFGANTLLTDLIAAAGGINVAAEAGYDDFRQMDDAAIRDLAPDVILLTAAWDDAARDTFAANPAYAGVPAVKTGRVFVLSFPATQPPDPGAALAALRDLLVSP